LHQRLQPKEVHLFAEAGQLTEALGQQQLPGAQVVQNVDEP
jgi:hypothetical protein